MLCVDCGPSCVVCCVSFSLLVVFDYVVARCLMCVVRCVMFGVRGLLFVVCYLLLAD